MDLPFLFDMLGEVKYSNDRLNEIMDTVKPDVVVLDCHSDVPALTNKGVPWILSTSMSPTGICKENTPPAYSGYPSDGDRRQWQLYDNRVKEVYKDFFDELNNWFQGQSGKKSEFNFPFWGNYSPYANMYMYPMELDYTNLRPNPPNWYQFDAFVRTNEETFEIPQKLRAGEGKLIYFSMGTIGSIDVNMMKRLNQILSYAKHRFIISKGPRGVEFELGNNMWGENSVPQTKVLPLVDLVITHGGNNSITESFYFGKRVLVLPLLWDQLDNGQRVYETGLGLQFNPYKVTESQLLEAVDFLLADELLENKMSSIGKRIRAANSQSAAANLVEEIARKNKK